MNLTDPARVAGFVNPGDKVAIFMTHDSSTFSRLLLGNIQVIGVGATTMVAATTATEDGSAPAAEQPPRRC